MVKIVWGEDQVPIYLLCMAHFKSLALTFDGKNKKQWGVTWDIE
jgi:hypothetical protein